jgi:hypothetical protein
MNRSGLLIISLLLLFTLVLFAQDSGTGIHSPGESPIPSELFRPRYGETLHFPRDYVIGDLGRGDAPEEAYQSARTLIGDLLRGGDARQAIPEEQWNKNREVLDTLEPRSFRIGGGRNEADGSVSFLVRFLGRETASAGELYLRKSSRKNADTEADTPSYLWQAEDLLLEEAAPLTMGKYGPGSADMSIYERFF